MSVIIKYSLVFLKDKLPSSKICHHNVNNKIKFLFTFRCFHPIELHLIIFSILIFIQIYKTTYYLLSSFGMKI